MNDRELLDDLEKELIARIKFLQSEYERAAMPFVKELVNIRAMRMPAMRMPLGEAIALGIRTGAL